LAKYGDPTWAIGGRVGQANVNGEAIERLNVAEAVAPMLSVTRTVNVNVPAVVGVPLSTHPELKLSPGGSVPPMIAHTYGGTPPLGANVCEYGTFTWP